VLLQLWLPVGLAMAGRAARLSLARRALDSVGETFVRETIAQIKIPRDDSQNRLEQHPIYFTSLQFYNL
jgi:hypothetical protein